MSHKAHTCWIEAEKAAVIGEPYLRWTFSIYLHLPYFIDLTQGVSTRKGDNAFFY